MKFYDDEHDMITRALCLSTSRRWTVTDKAAVFSEALFEEAYQGIENNIFLIKGTKKEQKEFINQVYLDYIKDMEETVPDHIKNKVADMRVLAMGTVTKQILDELEEYSNAAKLRMKELETNYKKHYDYTMKHMSEKTMVAMERSFHDSSIIDCGYEGRNLFFTLRMDGNFEHLNDQYLKLILKDAITFEGEICIELGVWIYHELYFEAEQYQLYIRFSNGTVMLQATDIYSEHLYSFFASNTIIQEQINDEFVFGKVKDLIALGKITREDTMDDSLRKRMGDEEYENMEIAISKTFDSLGKLAVCESPDHEEFSKLSGKKYIYEIKFSNDWGYNPNEMLSYWKRGEELLQYIKVNCDKELELWVIWSDSFSDYEYEEYQLEAFVKTNLEKYYDRTRDGIAKSRRITIKA